MRSIFHFKFFFVEILSLVTIDSKQKVIFFLRFVVLTHLPTNSQIEIQVSLTRNPLTQYKNHIQLTLNNLRHNTTFNIHPLYRSSTALRVKEYISHHFTDHSTPTKLHTDLCPLCYYSLYTVTHLRADGRSLATTPQVRPTVVVVSSLCGVLGWCGLPGMAEPDEDHPSSPSPSGHEQRVLQQGRELHRGRPTLRSRFDPRRVCVSGRRGVQKDGERQFVQMAKTRLQWLKI